ncbi:hypothetical protein N9A45_01215 [bacterium]|nr:hypothetical protein [bacterium]
MLLFFVYLLCVVVHAHKCCKTCTCSNRCRAPDISASLNMSGLMVHCPGADCACVVDELDTCTLGDVWTNTTEIRWQDPRWNKCIKIETLDPLRARAMIRWWHDKCMGHILLNLDVGLESIHRDLYVDFNRLAYFEHDTIHNVFRIKTSSGSNDKRPMAGSSEMYFQVTLLDEHIGVHVEITNCTVQVIEGKNIHANVMNEINVFDPTKITALGNDTTKLTYGAFWDYQTNSPFQRLVCSYGLFNGTLNLLHHSVNRTYMLANPDETGVLVNNVDNIITSVQMDYDST